MTGPKPDPATAPIIGIDLGTTNSLCAVFADGVPTLIKNPHDAFLTPSVVGMLEDGRLVVGSAGRELRVTRPERAAACFKRLMGTNRTLGLAENRFSAPELSSLLLKTLKHDAEAHLGVTITDAVITVPAYFDDNQRQATRIAGELAGLRVRRIIHEPTAAALTYGFHDRGADKKLIVIDLGGGTFDVTVMEIFEGTLEIISTAGESFLGGEDFTDRLVAWALQSGGMQLEATELQEPLRIARLRQECEQAKVALGSVEPGTEIPVRIPDADGRYGPNTQTVHVTHELFGAVSQHLLERLAKPISKALRDAECDPDDVEDIILVGGATRMGTLRSFVRDYFGREPLATYDPDQVVALGAAVQAALIADDRAVEDMVMTDVCPFSLGVEIVKQFGGQIVDGYYLPVIHRNTTIPVSREEIVSTVHASQRELLIHVYQGEARKVKDNLLLGELAVKDIPPSKAGTPVNLRFTYDINGILEVEALVPSTGKKVRTVLTRHVQGMSDKAIESAVKSLAKLKFYPRDDMANQRLVLYAERMIGEVSPYQRSELEEGIDVFEAALSAGDRAFFAQARQALLMLLSQLDVPYDESATEPGDG